MEEKNIENQTADIFVADEETTRFVKEQLAKGRLEEYIIDILVSRGMDKVKAKYIVHDISYYSDPDLNASSSKGLVLMITGIVFVCIGIALCMFMFLNGSGQVLPPLACIITGGGLALRGHSIRSNND